ncbi:MAG TPA: hypothetical protein VL282_03765 [Tepidisphaeraceae bacterium]|nr:hypothetical protein [Tepidisphaeraceae bacterium]
MNTDKKRRDNSFFFICVYLCSSVVPFFFLGCAKPSAANIELRKTNQQLQSRIDDLNRQHDADSAKIRSLEESKGAVPTLQNDRLTQLFTTHGIEFGKLTRVDDKTLKVYVVPTDDEGQSLKAAGTFEVELFDLAQTQNTLLGKWNFDADQTRKSWQGTWPLYTYVLEAPLQNAPSHEDLTVRVTFTDTLTGRSFTAQKQIKRTTPSTTG